MIVRVPDQVLQCPLQHHRLNMHVELIFNIQPDVPACVFDFIRDCLENGTHINQLFRFRLPLQRQLIGSHVFSNLLDPVGGAGEN